MECELCNKTKEEKNFYSTYKWSDYQVCNDCESNLDNKTGYCSIHCRVTGNCDESC